MLGIRKKYERNNQALSEMVGRVNKELNLGSDIQKMGEKTDTFKKLIKNIQEETEKYLQPDPKLRKKYPSSPRLERTSTDTLATTTLVETMTTYGRQLDEFQDNETESKKGDSKYLGKSLVEFGDSLEQICDQKNAHENSVRQNFLEPLDHILSKDFKEVSFHRRKLESRRLNYSYK